MSSSHVVTPVFCARFAVASIREAATEPGQVCTRDMYTQFIKKAITTVSTTKKVKLGIYLLSYILFYPEINTIKNTERSRMMLETDIVKICKKVRDSSGYSLRSILVYFYHCQLQDTDETRDIFGAFFKWKRDAAWCRKQVQIQIGLETSYNILWPPLPLTQTQTGVLHHTSGIRVIRVRGNVYVPVSPVVMDHRLLRQCLALYHV